MKKRGKRYCLDFEMVGSGSGSVWGLEVKSESRSPCDLTPTKNAQLGRVNMSR